MLLNLDVWHEIIGHLNYPQDELTLRSLALTSSMHSGPAMDVIWREGKTFLNIVSVINWFTTSPEKPFLEYGRKVGRNSGEDNGGRLSETPRGATWILNGSIPDASRKRAFEYLARIRKLEVSLPWVPQKEESLWPVLSDCLGSPGPLLPYLQHLKIDHAHKDRLSCVLPLLSPSIKILKIHTVYIPEQEFTLPLLKLTRAYGCDLQVFTYDGGQVQHVPEIITSFKNLRNVRFPFRYSLPQHITVVEFLASLPSLRSLTCSMDVFLPCTVDNQLYHNNLRKVDIKSTAMMLHGLFRCCIFPSVTEAKISKYGFEFLGFEGLDSCFPNARKLDALVYPMARADGTPALEFAHVAPLLSLPVRKFKLRVGKFNLTPLDFQNISRSWPKLYSFEIRSKNGLESDVLSSLIAFSGHPRLRHLDLGIRPRYLLEDITRVPDLMAAHTPSQNPSTDLRNLHLTLLGRNMRETHITRSNEKRIVVEFLLLLFPNLKGFKSREQPLPYIDYDAVILAELKVILSEVRNERAQEANN